MNETKKLSGPPKDRFFKRFLTEGGGLDEKTADRLTEQSAKIFSSVRVRKNADDLLAEMTAGLNIGNAAETAPAPVRPAPTKPVEAPPSARKPQPDAPPANPEPSAPESAAPDPFVFGLIPTYKREGAEGLSAKLATIATADHLRAMAKAQQIVLARELRTGDIDVTTLRLAILEAVEKRIADRRAV